MQATPVIQQRGGKNIAGRILTPAGLKTASLVNSIQPVSVTTAGSIQIGNNVHNITAVQSLLSGNNTQAAAAAIRMKAAAAVAGGRRNVVVGGLQSVAMNAAAIASSNGTTVVDAQTINCTKMQTVGGSQPHHQQLQHQPQQMAGSAHLSAGELQTLAGTLTAAPTIGTIQLTRNVQTLPAASVHLVTSNNSAAQTINAVGKNAATLNSIQLNAATADGIMAAKGQKMLRLSSNQDSTSQTSVELPMSALSALLSGKRMYELSSEQCSQMKLF